MKNETDLVADIATKHGIPNEAVAEALKALRRGNGTMAQFSHPAFGGMAQWSKGGMSMVGDMFDSKTKARFDAVMKELSEALAGGLEESGGDPDRGADGKAGATEHGSGSWPADFGSPSSSGSQNDMRYAFFPSARRLVIDSDGKRRIYDTGDVTITGVSQQQAGTRSLRFSSAAGTVSLDDLKALD